MKARLLIKRPRAVKDISYHFHYIGLDSTEAALKFIDEVDEAFDFISRLPGAGTAVQSSEPRLAGIRYVTVSKRFRNFLIFFRPTDVAIEVLTILHGARDLRAALEDVELD